MTLSQYLVYAAVTSPFLLIIAFIILTFKSWLDKRTFRVNTAHAYAAQQVVMNNWLDDGVNPDFDDHVASTPGMTNLN